MTSPSDARSALNLRLALALFGVVASLAGVVAYVLTDHPTAAAACAVLALVAIIDAAWVQVRRRARRRAEHALVDHSLFE